MSWKMLSCFVLINTQRPLQHEQGIQPARLVSQPVEGMYPRRLAVSSYLVLLHPPRKPALLPPPSAAAGLEVGESESCREHNGARRFQGSPAVQMKASALHPAGSRPPRANTHLQKHGGREWEREPRGLGAWGAVFPLTRHLCCSPKSQAVQLDSKSVVQPSSSVSPGGSPQVKMCEKAPLNTCSSWSHSEAAFALERRKSWASPSGGPGVWATGTGLGGVCLAPPQGAVALAHSRALQSPATLAFAKVAFQVYPPCPLGKFIFR